MRTYIAIDLKSFYASVECRERGLDPLTTRLVVADETRTAKTICLAVSPALKAYGVPGRPRLFEVNKIAEEAKIDFTIAKPRMALYLEYSTKIYEIYLKYVSKDDIHVYSIDEVFIDITSYMEIYSMPPEKIARMMIGDVLSQTGITATAGVGTNLYLAKIAMDIMAKKTDADEKGVRVATLDEISYRELLWDHKPLTDFWRVGKGYANKLNKVGITTMGEVAKCAVGNPEDYYNEDLLYELFGVNAELLIDHAFGYEPCTIAEIKSYVPETNSISSGQVLTRPYEYHEIRLIVKEMTELLTLDLVKKGLVTNQIMLTLGYDIDNLTREDISEKYTGAVVVDRYGRRIPKHAHGTENLKKYTASSLLIGNAMMKLFDRIVNPDLLVRRVTVVAADVMYEQKERQQDSYVQMDLFADFGINGSVDFGGQDGSSMEIEQLNTESEKEEREKRVQEAAIAIKKKFGKNAILKGMNLEEGGTTIERNAQIGGHKA